MRNSLIATLISLAALQSGCSGCDAGTEDGEGGSGAGNGSGGSPSSTGGTTGSFSGGNGSGGNGNDCITCSADLHHVLDCNGNVLATCGAGEGCSPDGTCVPACESAGTNRSTFGCDFYSMTPAIIDEARGSCFAVMVANTWDTPVSIGLAYGGQSVDAGAYTYVPQGTGTSLSYQPVGAGGQLAPGQLGVVFLSSYESGDIFQVDCPRPPWLNVSTHIEGDGFNKSGRGNAFHLTTTAPVVMYDVFPWGGASSFATSSTLLLPTPTWGDNFVTADAGEAGAGQPFTQVVAAENNTTVTFVPRTNLTGGGGLPGGAAGTPVTFMLNAGETAQFVQGQRLIGSTLQADKPVSVWGGATCLNIPNNAYACDAAHQQTLPVQSLGNEYVVARYPSRGGDDSAPVTLVGMVDGTTLVADPPVGVPGTLNKGETAIVWTTEPFKVVSQDTDHPFYVAAHMTGAQLTPNDSGDPEYVNVVPPAQYLPYYLFATDPTYAYTALAFVRKKDENGVFQDVTLDCMGPITAWTPVGSTGEYESARFLIVNQFSPVGGCDNGVHTASSTTPFGLTVWGYDTTASYAYPAGMSLETINTVVVPVVPE